MTSNYLFDDLMPSALSTGTVQKSKIWFDAKLDMKCLQFDVFFDIKSSRSQTTNKNFIDSPTWNVSRMRYKLKFRLSLGTPSTRRFDEISFSNCSRDFVCFFPSPPFLNSPPSHPALFYIFMTSIYGQVSSCIVHFLRKVTVSRCYRVC